MKISVLGGGSWATAIVKMLTENLDDVHWYMRNSVAIEHIKKEGHNPNYLSAVELLNERITLTDVIDEAVNTSEILVFAIPSAFLETELQKLTVSLKDKIIFSAIKGIVPETGLIVGEHFHEIFKVPFENLSLIHI